MRGRHFLRETPVVLMRVSLFLNPSGFLGLLHSKRCSSYSKTEIVRIVAASSVGASKLVNLKASLNIPSASDLNQARLDSPHYAKR